MLLAVIDGNGILQYRIVAGQETLVDQSGTITVDDTAQELMAENTDRSGFYIQNASIDNDMWLNELGADATQASPSIRIPAGGSLIAPNGYPLTTNALSIIGKAGDAFVAREW